MHSEQKAANIKVVLFASVAQTLWGQWIQCCCAAAAAAAYGRCCEKVCGLIEQAII